MMFKIFLAALLLLETIALQVDEKSALSIVDITNESCKCSFGWKNGVQQYYNRCMEVANKLCGPSYAVGQSLMASLKSYQEKLETLSQCNSTFLSLRSADILYTMCMLCNLGGSPNNILNEFSKVIPQLASNHRKIVSSLSGRIGQLTKPVNYAITGIEFALKQVLNAVLKISLFGLNEKIGFESIAISLRVFTNTLASIAEHMLNDSKLNTSDCREAFVVLVLSLNQFSILAHGTFSCYAEILYSSSLDMPDVLKTLLLSINTLLLGMTYSINSITFSVAESITFLLKTLISLNASLNEILSDVFGLFEGVTIGQITRNLLQNV